MTTKKSIRLGKSLKYELFLIFDRFKGYTVKEIFDKLPKNYASLKTVYNYHQRFARAEKKMKELTRNW